MGACLHRSEDSLWKFVLTFHPMGPKDGTLVAVSGLVTSPLTHTEPSQGSYFLCLRQGHFIVQAGLDIDTEPKGNLGSSSYASPSQVLGLDSHTPLPVCFTSSLSPQNHLPESSICCCLWLLHSAALRSYKHPSHPQHREWLILST